MSETQQSSFTILTLSEWMIRHHEQFDDVVFALCQIFDLPEADLVTTYVEQEIDRQARLLLIADGPTILGLAGWNWAHIDIRETELPVYLGIRRNLDIEGLRMTLVSTVKNRLKEERILSGHTHVETMLLQYHPADRDLRDLCETLGFVRDKRRNESFKTTLGASGYLRSMTAPFAP